MPSLVIGDKAYTVRKVAGLEIYTAPARLVVISLLESLDPSFTFYKKVEGRYDGRQVDIYLYIYRYEFDIPDFSGESKVAIVLGDSELYKHLLLLLEKDNLALAIPLKACRWYIDCDISHLMMMHDV